MLCIVTIDRNLHVNGYSLSIPFLRFSQQIIIVLLYQCPPAIGRIPRGRDKAIWTSEALYYVILYIGAAITTQFKPLSSCYRMARKIIGLGLLHDISSF